MNLHSDDLNRTMLTLLAWEGKNGSDQYIQAKTLAKESGLPDDALNDAIEILESHGLLDVERFLGTIPYTFGITRLTARGRASAKDLEKRLIAQDGSHARGRNFEETDENQERAVAGDGMLNVFPTGSPFGFTQEDWDEVQLQRDQIDKLVVVFGHQWNSTHFESMWRAVIGKVGARKAREDPLLRARLADKEAILPR